jgi:hypothetical protein
VCRKVALPDLRAATTVSFHLSEIEEEEFSVALPMQAVPHAPSLMTPWMTDPLAHMLGTASTSLCSDKLDGEGSVTVASRAYRR